MIGIEMDAGDKQLHEFQWVILLNDSSRAARARSCRIVVKPGHVTQGKRRADPPDGTEDEDEMPSARERASLQCIHELQRQDARATQQRPLPPPCSGRGGNGPPLIHFADQATGFADDRGHQNGTTATKARSSSLRI